MVYDSNDTSADRSQTQDLLNLFKKEVIETMIQKRVVELTGAKEKSLLPVSDTIQGLKIGCLFTRCRTSFAVSATFNPGGTGYAALKAFKDSDGKPIAIVPDDTKQIMGWSQNSSQMFLYNSNIDLGVEDGATSVRLELWFHPDNSGEPRLITSHVMTVDTKICDGEICE